MAGELAMIGTGMMTFLVILIMWSAIWKGIALYRAGVNKQKAWFIVMFLLNTIGILPIIYLFAFQKRKNN